ncbi:putative acylesterase/phospholipase RssA [Mycobacterium sp. URHB0021]
MSTDLISGESVWLQRGAVDAAIRATIAIPGVVMPHVLALTPQSDRLGNDGTSTARN